MKKILVAYDGSEGADLAIADLLRGGFPRHAEALVLAVADVWMPPVMPESDRSPPGRCSQRRSDEFRYRSADSRCPSGDRFPSRRTD